jgi:hypothetical protein
MKASTTDKRKGRLFMKLKSVVALYEAKVAEYVNKGYAVIKMRSYESWVDYYTDLINGEESIRISLTDETIGNWDVHYKGSGLKLTVARYVSYYKQNEIESQKWYKITNDWYVSEEESKKAFQIMYHRIVDKCKYKDKSEIDMLHMPKKHYWKKRELVEHFLRRKHKRLTEFGAYEHFRLYKYIENGKSWYEIVVYENGWLDSLTKRNTLHERYETRYIMR